MKYEDPELKMQIIKKIDFDCFVMLQRSLCTAQRIMKFENYSCLQRLVRVVAWCIRFIVNCSTKVKKVNGEIEVDEYNKAMEICIKSEQILFYIIEYFIIYRFDRYY